MKFTLAHRVVQASLIIAVGAPPASAEVVAANVSIKGTVKYRIIKDEGRDAGKFDDTLGGVNALVFGQLQYRLARGAAVPRGAIPVLDQQGQPTGIVYHNFKSDPASNEGKYTLQFELPAAAIAGTQRKLRVYAGGALNDKKEGWVWQQLFDDIPETGFTKEGVNFLAQQCPCLPGPYEPATPRMRLFLNYENDGIPYQMKCTNTAETGNIIFTTMVPHPEGGSIHERAIGRCMYPKGINNVAIAPAFPAKIDRDAGPMTPKYHVQRCVNNAAKVGFVGEGAPVHDLAVFVFDLQEKTLVRLKAKSQPVPPRSPVGTRSKYKEVGTRKTWTQAQLASGFVSLVSSYEGLYDDFEGFGTSKSDSKGATFQSVHVNRVALVSGPCEPAVRWSVLDFSQPLPDDSAPTPVFADLSPAPPPSLMPDDAILIDDLTVAALTYLSDGFTAADGNGGLVLTVTSQVMLHTDDVLLAYNPDPAVLGFSSTHAPSNYFIADRSATAYWNAILDEENPQLLDEDPFDRPDNAGGAGQVRLGGPGAPGDMDCDGDVDGLDLAQLLAAWGRYPPDRACRGDLDRNGIVNGLDLSILLSHWT